MVWLKSLKGRDFLCLKDFTPEELWSLLKTAAYLKTGSYLNQQQEILAGKTLGMVFAKNSTRTRVSFEVAMWQLGGHALFLNAQDLQLGRGETIADTARVFSRYLDGIMIRTYAHEDVVELARYADIPVINGLTDWVHPCQALADIFTLYEKKGRVAGLKLAYVGDGNNVAHSLLYGGALFGMKVFVATPPAYRPSPAVVEEATAIARETGGTVAVVDDPREAVRGADAVYTDVWVSMGQEAEREERLAVFRPYQVNAGLMALADERAVVLHCLPAHKGEEVTEEVFEGPQSVVFDQAENRLHVQKAILAMLL
ncbi:MAG: ornithine carbamoyltransferase [Firmicutes bacterium]|nr:ornithine carbamoyltransferase [Bacillota bacterium]